MEGIEGCNWALLYITVAEGLSHVHPSTVEGWEVTKIKNLHGTTLTGYIHTDVVTARPPLRYQRTWNPKQKRKKKRKILRVITSTWSLQKYYKLNMIWRWLTSRRLEEPKSFIKFISFKQWNVSTWLEKRYWKKQITIVGSIPRSSHLAMKTGESFHVKFTTALSQSRLLNNLHSKTNWDHIFLLFVFET